MRGLGSVDVAPPAGRDAAPTVPPDVVQSCRRSRRPGRTGSAGRRRRAGRARRRGRAGGRGPCPGAAPGAAAGGRRAGRLRRVVQHRGEGRHGLFLREGRAAFDGHVEGRPERPQVGRRPRGLAADEFGRHERRRPDDVAGAAGGMGGVATGGLGDAEIHQHRSPVLAEHHIRGLDVAVHDAGRVHGAQRGEQLQAQRGDRRRGQSTPASAQDGGQAGTLVVVHHQPVRAVVHHHVVHDGHVGMPDPGREPCLDPAVCVVDLLDGDVAVQQFVAGSPHPCRRPAADDLGQPVTAGQEQTGVGICGRRLLCPRSATAPSPACTRGPPRPSPARPCRPPPM